MLRSLCEVKIILLRILILATLCRKPPLFGYSEVLHDYIILYTTIISHTNKNFFKMKSELIFEVLFIKTACFSAFFVCTLVIWKQKIDTKICKNKFWCPFIWILLIFKFDYPDHPGHIQRKNRNNHHILGYLQIDIRNKIHQWGCCNRVPPGIFHC